MPYPNLSHAPLKPCDEPLPSAEARRLAGCDELITSAEARRLAGGVSDMALWRWLKRGIIPEPLRIERRRYWNRRQFMDSLIAAGTRADCDAVQGAQ